jgi:hypothetical protein
MLTIEEVKKRCTGECKELKPLAEFHKGGHGPDGRKARCAKCTSKARPSRAVRPVRIIGIKSNCMEGWWL